MDSYKRNTHKIISWNCNMAFRNKYHELNTDTANILIIQECESPKIMIKKGFGLKHNDYIWIGHNANKGLAAISLGETKIWKDVAYTDQYKYILPIRTNILDELILCVWTQNAKNKNESYIAQLVQAIKHYSEVYPTEKLIIIGDFNSNAQFDKAFKLRTDNHSLLVSLLNNKGIYSIYHNQYDETHGHETRPTFFQYKDLKKKYQIDYAFVPSKYLSNSTFQIGDIDKYIRYSDHLPVYIELNKDYE